MKKASILSIILAVGFVCNAVSSNFEQNSSAVFAATDTKLRGSVVSVPRGTAIPATATMELSSDTLIQGQDVSIVAENDYYYKNSLVVPAGSSFNGTVTQVKKSGRAGINGQLMITFTKIITPYGQMIPISGVIQTDDGTGLIKGGTKIDSAKEYTKDVAIGAASGAATGALYGALSDSKVSKSVMYGAAVGAGLGLIKSFADRGDPAVIPVGTVVNVILNQQSTFTPVQGYQY